MRVDGLGRARFPLLHHHINGLGAGGRAQREAVGGALRMVVGAGLVPHARGEGAAGAGGTGGAGGAGEQGQHLSANRPNPMMCNLLLRKITVESS